MEDYCLYTQFLIRTNFYNKLLIFPFLMYSLSKHYMLLQNDSLDYS